MNKRESARPDNSYRRRALLLFAAALCLFLATSCRSGRDNAANPGTDADAQIQFAAAWGTDLSSGGNLSGPAALQTLDNGHLLVLDRFNRRIQEYLPDGRWLGEWGKTSDGAKFPFTVPVDLTMDAGNGDIVVGVINNISPEAMNSFHGGMFPADTFLRFSQDGRFKGPGEMAQALKDSPANDPDFTKLIDYVFWNRNELLPMSLFGRIAADSKIAPDVWLVLMGPLMKHSVEGEAQEKSLTVAGKTTKDFCDIETDGLGGMYLVSCLQRAEVFKTSVKDVMQGRMNITPFAPRPTAGQISATADTRADIFKHDRRTGNFALYSVKEAEIFVYSPGGEKIKEVKIAPKIQYASDMDFDGSGGFFISDYVEDCVLHLSAGGELLNRIGTRRDAPGQFAGRSFTLFITDPDKGEIVRPAGIVGVAEDAAGNVYASDAGNHRVHKFAPGGKVLFEYAPCAGVDGPCYPADVLISNNSLYVSLYGPQAVVKLDPVTGGTLAKWNAEPRSATAICGMCGMGADPAGNIYVADGESIFKLSPALVPDSKWKKDSFRTPTLANPYDVAADSAGNIFVVGTKGAGILATASAVCRYSPSMALEKCFQIPNLYHPRAVAAEDGMIFVSNSGRDTVLQMTSDGVPVTQIGGEGRAPGMFQNPLGLAADTKGNLFVADNGNERIQQFKVKK